MALFLGQKKKILNSDIGKQNEKLGEGRHKIINNISNVLWMHRSDSNPIHAKTTSWILEMQFSLPSSWT